MSLLHTSARVLEFDVLRNLLRGYASSPLGQSRIDALAPSTDRAWIESQQQLSSEIREFRRVGGRFDFSSLLDITRSSKNPVSPESRSKPPTSGMSFSSLIVPRSGEPSSSTLPPP